MAHRLHRLHRLKSKDHVFSVTVFKSEYADGFDNFYLVEG